MRTPAEIELRAARREVFATLGYFVKRKMAKEGVSKGDAWWAAYLWLSRQMGISASSTGISNFTLEQCRIAMHACKPYLKPRPPSKQMKLL